MFAIRDYHPSDIPMLYRICLQTGEAGADATGTVDPDILGHYFAAPYAIFEPGLCSILTRDGEPVGYILGTADTSKFEQICETQWWPDLRQRYPLPARDDRSRDANMTRAIHCPTPTPLTLVREYPAHLHIDILPPGQGQGYGRELIERFVGQLKARQVIGLHFGVSTRNVSAIGFYERLGFKVIAREGGTLIFGQQL